MIYLMLSLLLYPMMKELDRQGSKFKLLIGVTFSRFYYGRARRELGLSREPLNHGRARRELVLSNGAPQSSLAFSVMAIGESLGLCSPKDCLKA